MAGVGGTQIINGQTYTQYTPEWYAAMDANKIRTAGVAGTAAGTAGGDAAKTELGILNGVPGSGVPGATATSSTGAAVPPTVPFGGSGGSLGGLQAAAGVAPSGGASGGSTALAPVDTSAATSAAFNAAKDQTGLETSGALTGLRSALAGRGMLGSGAEVGGTTGVINEGQAELGNASRANATTQAGIAQTEALANQSANVTTRGQDVNAEEAAYQGQVAQRGQDIAATTAANSLAMQSTLQQAALRQQVLTGLLSAIGPSSSPTY